MVRREGLCSPRVEGAPPSSPSCPRPASRFRSAPHRSPPLPVLSPRPNLVLNGPLRPRPVPHTAPRPAPYLTRSPLPPRAPARLSDPLRTQRASALYPALLLASRPALIAAPRLRPASPHGSAPSPQTPTPTRHPSRAWEPTAPRPTEANSHGLC